MKKHIRHKRHRPKDRVAFFLRVDETNELIASFSVTKAEFNKLQIVGEKVYGLDSKQHTFYDELFVKLIEEMIKQDGELYDNIKTD